MSSPLDETLPPDLKPVAEKADRIIAQASTEQEPEKAMSDTPITQADIDQAVASAKSEIKDMLQAEKAEQAVADKVEQLTRDELAAKAEANDARAELTTANERIAALEAEKADLETAHATAISEKDAELATANEKAEAAETKLAEQQAQLDKLNTEQAIASRKAVLAEAKITNERFVDRATATDEDGKLTQSDEAFNTMVEDVKALATEAPAPEGSGDGDPTADEQATATEEQPDEEVTPAAPATPGGNAAIQALASAATAPASQSGASKYAAAFPIS